MSGRLDALPEFKDQKILMLSTQLQEVREAKYAAQDAAKKLGETLRGVYDELTNIDLALVNDDPDYQGWWVKWDDIKEKVIPILVTAEGKIRDARFPKGEM